MVRTTTLALAALAAAGVLIGGATTALADDGSGGKTADVTTSAKTAASPSLLAPHQQFFGPFVTVPPGGNGVASVACPAGQVPTGGGGTTSAFKIFFTDSFASGNTWTVRGTNTNTVNESIRAFVICTTP
ncbi:hypothetical protein [Streptomyces javensis]|uniref:Secreted protein n=1 Tax=Streptomyces javensis TaxID=114698 RepID=A0ABS0RAI7_9ACTN|nr:hypothetical protein [Streptomyces javensis]MBI0314325.1 hypothetical protein [Streptomyces javensis]